MYIGNKLHQPYGLLTHVQKASLALATKLQAACHEASYFALRGHTLSFQHTFISFTFFSNSVHFVIRASLPPKPFSTKMPPSGRRKGRNPVFLLFLVFCQCISLASAASAVLGIDLGTEYIKAALVKPGIPLEIVLTKDSRRKEAAALAFKPLRSSTSSADPDVFPERAYGADALALAARFPVDVYPNLKPLLGITYKDSPFVAEYGSRYPELRLVESKERGTVAFRSESFNRPESFLVEELLAMELQNIRANAEAFAGKGSIVKDVVFTLPAFYTAQEKRAVEAAASMAGLRVLGFVTDGLAVGLNYATSRTFSESKPEYHIVYDMGAGSTTATVLRFQGKVVKDVGRFNKTIQEVQVLGTGWDKTLGGDVLNTLILDDMLQKFLDTNRIKALGPKLEHVKSHGRTMAKLWKESERMRQVLSANTATSASFEGLFYDDVNFKYTLSRSDFESMIAAMEERIRSPYYKALAMSKLKTADIESIILHGGAVRTPFVQKQLEAVAGGSEKVRTSVNSDEAAVFGAAFKAAGISPSFRVKEIWAGEIATHGVNVRWSSKEGKDRQQKLFVPSSQASIEKQFPIKLTEDFQFELYQEIVDTSDSTGPIGATVVKVQNLTASVKELTTKYGCSAANISTKFTLRLSPVTGLPEATQGSVSCEVVDQGKVGGVVDDVKGFFGFGSKKGDQVPLGTEEDLEESNAETEVTTSSSTSSPSEVSTPEASTSASKKDEKSKEGKKRVEIIPLQLTLEPIGLPQLTPTELGQIKDRLTAFDASDRSRRLREEALNTLEGYTYKVRDMVEDEGFITSSTSEERASIERLSKSASEWLYGEGSDATRDALKSRLKEIRDLVDPIQKRKDEAKRRPAEIKSLRDTLNQTGSLINIMKESAEKASSASSASIASSESSASEPQMTTDPSSTVKDEWADLDDDTTTTTTSTTTSSTMIPQAPVYTQEELADVSKTYESIQTWLDEKMAIQEKLGPTDDPVIFSADLAKKSQELNKVIMDLLQKKMRIPPKPKSSSKPKVKKPKVKKGKESKTATLQEVPAPTDSTSTEGDATTTNVENTPEASPSIKDEL